MDEVELHFKKPVELRDRFRNLDTVVQIALRTGEDPIVLASASGVSPSALIRQLPRKYLTQFVPDAEQMTTQQIVLALAANHALDAAVEGLVSGMVDAKSTLVTARDVMDLVALMTTKKGQGPRRLELSAETVAKFLELEQVFTAKGLGDGKIAPEFSAFVQTQTRGSGDGTGGQKDDDKIDPEVWHQKGPPEIRELLNLEED